MNIKNSPKIRYKRILLKLSGEALQGEKNTAVIDEKIVGYIANEVNALITLGVQVAIVIGGGNFFRGRTLSALGIDRVTADQMGMVSTVVNALALRDAFVHVDIPSYIMSAIHMQGIAEPFDRHQAIYYLEQQHVVLFAGGTGNPLVTTDSAASLRSIEVKADILLKATNVDGIYSQDPRKHADARLFKHLTYQEVLQKELGIMDIAAFSQCRDNHMPIRVFNIHKSGALRNIICGKNEGTLVDDQGETHAK